jgi:hypothetical protein
MLYVAGMPANESSWLKGGANTNTVNPNGSNEPNTYMIARMSQSPALFGGKYDSWTTTNTNADGSTTTTTTSTTTNATVSPITSSDAHRRANEKLVSSQYSSSSKAKGRQRKQRRAANKNNNKVCPYCFDVYSSPYIALKQRMPC